MNSPSIIRWKFVVALFSLALNVVLVSAILRAHLTAPNDTPASAVLTNRHIKVGASRSPLPDVRPVVYITNAGPSAPLSWAGIESRDYTQYAANLRAAGVPEQVVKDILTADIGKTFGARMAAIRGPARPYKYWQRYRPPDLTDEQKEELRMLDGERRAALKAVLGREISAQSVIDELVLQTRGYASVTAFLPEQKREAARAAMQHADTEFEWSVDDAEDYSRRQRDRERLRMVELAKVLTPEELDNYKFRSSETANRVRGELRDFEVTPEEFRALVEVKQASEVQPKRRENPSEYQKRQMEELTKALGQVRATEYLRATDLAWINARQIAEREGLSSDSADKVYAIKQSTDATLEQIRTDKTLETNQRRVQIEAAKSSAEKSVRAVLGESGFKRYQWRGGIWMGNIR